MKAVAKALVIGVLAVMSQPALAHHVMGGMMPVTFMQGFLSGLGHPVIGLDHFAAMVAVGFIAAAHRKGAALITGYVLAMIVGVALHVRGVTIPGSEILVALSVLMLGVAMQLRVGASIALALFAVGGFVNGYALGESIAGAEATPLFAYFAGLAIIQTLVAMATMKLAQLFATDATPRLPVRVASAAIMAVGLVVLAVNVMQQA
ncbi:MAG: HupE/UreJ family protein [Xanthobacteraceae bacterium]